MKEYRSPARIAFMILNGFILTAAALTCILPFINSLAMSFSHSSAVAAGRVTFWPIGFTTAAYEYAFMGGKLIPALWISIKRVFLGCFVNLLLIVFTAYPLSKGRDKVAGRHIYASFFVFTMIFNGGLIPTYLLIVNLKLLNKIWALVLPYGLSVYNIVIMMNFMRELPDELEESARIDGAGVFSVLFRILLPLLTPSIATVGLFCIVFHWNEWFSGMIYMQNSSMYPLQTYLRTLVVRMDDILRAAKGDFAKILQVMNARTGRAAQLFLGMIPVLAAYPFLQKHFTTGLVLGSVKG